MLAKNLIYDGSFDGFLTTVFYVFEHNIESVYIQNEYVVQNQLFSENETIITDKIKANRVWKGIQSSVSKRSSFQIYYAFLSEKHEVELIILDYLRHVFSKHTKAYQDYSHPSVLKIAQIAKMVGREKHRMEAFVRFRLTKDTVYFASIEPDFNVLPLILKHFKRRYADQKWIIYDMQRHYGLYYDLKTVEIVNLDLPEQFDVTKTDHDFFNSKEFDFQKLWQDYFKSTNIKSRINMKLHIKHVPKRYWKYLSEKQPTNN